MYWWDWRYRKYVSRALCSHDHGHIAYVDVNIQRALWLHSVIVNLSQHNFSAFSLLGQVHGREFFLNFLTFWSSLSAPSIFWRPKNAYFYIFMFKKRIWVAVILPYCYSNTNNKVGTKRQNYCDNSQKDIWQLKYALQSVQNVHSSILNVSALITLRRRVSFSIFALHPSRRFSINCTVCRFSSELTSSWPFLPKSSFHSATVCYFLIFHFISVVKLRFVSFYTN